MRRNKYFLDTSAFIALNDVKDQYHKESRKIASMIKNSEWILSDSVITETYTLLKIRSGFSAALQFLESVMAEDQFTIPEVTPSIRKNTLQILKNYSNHNISYCDALSVAIMKEQGIQRIFAFDYHFEMMGIELVRL